MILVDSPAIFPDSVAHVSATVDVDGTESLDALVLGRRLPRRLRAALRSRQIEFLAGRACADQAILRLEPNRGGGVLGTLRSGAPRFPAGLTGSITHAAGFVSAAVARRTDAGGIGIDSEPAMSRPRASRVASRIATAREIAAAVSDAKIDWETAVTVLFSAKESLFKALYADAGRPFDFLDARIEMVHAGLSGALRTTLCVTLSDRARKGASFDGRFELRGGFVHTAIVIPPRPRDNRDRLRRRQ